jgi:hypothetical protein
LWKKRKTSRIIGQDGEPCQRCGKPTEVHEHIELTDRLLAQPFYYSRWFNCRNPDCRTTLIMPKAFRVHNLNYRKPHYERDSEFDRKYEQVRAWCRAYNGPAPWDE